VFVRGCFQPDDSFTNKIDREVRTQSLLKARKSVKKREKNGKPS
jgi:hypothetical protein